MYAHNKEEFEMKEQSGFKLRPVAGSVIALMLLMPGVVSAEDPEPPLGVNVLEATFKWRPNYVSDDTFMILGAICTRRCPFCDVSHGRPLAPDAGEPERLARTVAAMKLRYVVITSVDRDDLRDGGAGHFAQCMADIRALSPQITIEVLTPDFRGREAVALDALAVAPPDVFNHNMETVPRLYREVRPGANYEGSLRLIRDFGQRFPGVPTKTGLMLGLGETEEEVVAVMRDLRAHGCDLLTLGQYLRPSPAHLPVIEYITPERFDALRERALALGFSEVAAGPLVRSSYRADLLHAAHEKHD
jgi:lipoic acid synthetase